jgi:WS/DGAT/MGAT family acyltransferase
MDTLFLHMEQPHAPAQGGVAMLYDRSTAPGGELDFQDVVDHFEDRLHLMDALRMKLVRVPGNLDRPWWVEDPDFDIEFHMRNLALPPPGDWRQFCEQVSRLVARPLDLSRPVWELYMIDGLDRLERVPKGSFALILKIHHAALDGKAYAAIMDSLHSSEPVAEPPPPPDPNRRAEPEPTSWELLARAGRNATRAPAKAARALGGIVPGLSRAAVPGIRQRLRPAGEQPLTVRTPATRFNSPVGPHRSMGACFFALADTKPIRGAVDGATVGDIAVAVFGGALRSYLGEIGELPSQSMRAMLPVAVHAPTDRVGMGNQLSMMVVSMATDVADPLERLAAVRASTLAAKSTSATIGARNLSELMEIVPESAIAPMFRLATLAGTRSARGIGGMFNTMVSGLPGPTTPLYLAGAELVHVFGLGPVVDGMALINMHGSYNGEFTMFFTADRQAMPDPERYEECIEQSFHELRAAAR